jgi:tripartite-type tricarboxylate transporter receptor subunit TctC
MDPALLTRVIAAPDVTLKNEDIIKRMKDLGASPIGDTPDEFRAFLVKDSERWARVIKASGIKAD